MGNSKKPDEIEDKLIAGIKNTKNIDDSHLKELVFDIHKGIAKSIYAKTGKNSALRELGVSYREISEIKRPRGQPRVNMYSDRQIVQLVFKQELQVGLPFTNAKSWENNQCFTAVADYQQRSVKQVYEQWKSVPARERAKIRKWLEDLLRKHGRLHKRHQ